MNYLCIEAILSMTILIWISGATLFFLVPSRVKILLNNNKLIGMQLGTKVKFL